MVNFIPDIWRDEWYILDYNEILSFRKGLQTEIGEELEKSRQYSWILSSSLISRGKTRLLGWLVRRNIIYIYYLFIAKFWSILFILISQIFSLILMWAEKSNYSIKWFLPRSSGFDRETDFAIHPKFELDIGLRTISLTQILSYSDSEIGLEIEKNRAWGRNFGGFSQYLALEWILAKNDIRNDSEWNSQPVDWDFIVGCWLAFETFCKFHLMLNQLPVSFHHQLSHTKPSQKFASVHMCHLCHT